MIVEEKYMARCLQLAALGLGNVSPNPMVGAVVVCDGKIIGEGYHRRCGEAHAEVNAINSVKDQTMLERSTIYVSLEPCSHWGKTPPCAGLIIDKKIPRVVVGVADPYVEVSGRGIRMLREAGVEVVTGVMEKECAEINKVFFTVQQQKRPYVLLKWAQSRDGKIDALRSDRDAHAVRISDSYNSVCVHKLRSEVDAIMVGTNTALLDNPSLTVRKWDGRDPLRVVVDLNGKLSQGCNLLDGQVPTIVFTSEGNKADLEGVEFVVVPDGADLIQLVLEELHLRKVGALMVEGGACLLNNFINSGLWDEARVEIGDLVIGAGIEAPVLGNEIETWTVSDNSLIKHYRNFRK